jgi:hypothetical protein
MEPSPQKGISKEGIGATGAQVVQVTGRAVACISFATSLTNARSWRAPPAAEACVSCTGAAQSAEVLRLCVESGWAIWSGQYEMGVLVRRVRWREVEDLVTGRPYVGGLRVGQITFSVPLVNLYVSEERIVLQPRFGLATLCRPWVVERDEVTYVVAGRMILTDSVSIALESNAVLSFWTWRSQELVERLRDLGFPCKPPGRFGGFP